MLLANAGRALARRSAVDMFRKEAFMFSWRLLLDCVDCVDCVYCACDVLEWIV